MTTKNSPLTELLNQASRIARLLKAAERGDKIDVKFAEKIERARANRDAIKTAIVMDDKIISLEIPWSTIVDYSTRELTEYIVKLMREDQSSVH